MKSAKNRLKTLEAQLTPRQVIIHLVERMKEFDDLDAFILWGYTGETLVRMAETRENMYKAIKQGAGDKDPRKIHRACKKVQRELFFLYELAMAPSMRIKTNKYRYLYWISTMAHQLEGIFRKLKDSSKQEPTVKELAMFRDSAQKLLLDLVSEQLVVEWISQQYFDGRPLLFNSQQTFLEKLISRVEQMIELFNEALELFQVMDQPSESYKFEPVNVQKLRAEGKKFVPGIIEQVKQDSRISMYNAEGAHDEAIKLFKDSLSIKSGK